MAKAPIQMTPGDDTHLTLLMAPQSLNFCTGQDREHLLAYGRAAFAAGQASKCLLQIAEPAENRFEALISYLRERMKYSHARHGHTSRFVELKLEDAQEIESILCSAKLAAAPQAVQAAVPDGWKWMSIPSRCGGAIMPVRVFEEDGVKYYQPFDWENETAFKWDKRSKDWVEHEVSGPAHPAEGVPAQAASEIDERAAFDDFFRKRNRLHPDTDTTFRSDAAEPWKYWKARAAIAATQPAAQGLEADLTDEQIDEAFNQMPDGAAGFLKSWGYRQFARAVLAAQAKQGGAA